jgi:hypothetical protein
VAFSGFKLAALSMHRHRVLVRIVPLAGSVKLRNRQKLLCGERFFRAALQLPQLIFVNCGRLRKVLPQLTELIFLEN